MPWRCGWKSRLARVCTPPLRKTLTALILQLTLSVTPIQVVAACIWMWRKKTNPRAGLLHNQGVVASKAIANIPTWMGYFARWRVRCVSVSEASEILAGCKRLEKEHWRRARWDLQHRLSSMQLNSPLSATARPFQPQATPPLVLVDDTPQDYPAWNGLARDSPTWGSTPGLPVRGTTPNHHSTSDKEGVSTDTATPEKSFHKRQGSRRN